MCLLVPEKLPLWKAPLKGKELARYHPGRSRCMIEYDSTKMCPKEFLRDTGEQLVLKRGVNLL